MMSDGRMTTSDFVDVCVGLVGFGMWLIKCEKLHFCVQDSSYGSKLKFSAVNQGDFVSQSLFRDNEDDVEMFCETCNL